VVGYGTRKGDRKGRKETKRRYESCTQFQFVTMTTISVGATDEITTIHTPHSAVQCSTVQLSSVQYRAEQREQCISGKVKLPAHFVFFPPTAELFQDRFNWGWGTTHACAGSRELG
jgi:hypothetical protein